MRAPRSGWPHAGPRPLGLLELVLAVLGTGALAAAALLPIDAPPLSLFPCPLRAATGIPCFSCGATHAFSAFMHGHWADAAAHSPLAFLVALCAALHVAFTALRLCGIPYAPPAPDPGPVAALRIRWMIGAAVLANWIYLVLRTRP